MSSALSLLESNASWKCSPVDMGNNELRIDLSKGTDDNSVEEVHDDDVVENVKWWRMVMWLKMMGLRMMLWWM